MDYPDIRAALTEHRLLAVRNGFPPFNKNYIEH